MPLKKSVHSGREPSKNVGTLVEDPKKQCAVAYYSGRQSTVALCTARAETIALANLVVKMKHMRELLFDMQCRQEQETMIKSTCVWVDNTAAIAVSTGNDFTHETVNM